MSSEGPPPPFSPTPARPKMLRTLSTWLLSLPLALAAVILADGAAVAQSAPPLIESESWDAESAPRSPMVTLGLEGVLSSRSFDAAGSQGATTFSAPLQPGLRVSGALFPLSVILERPGHAAGFGVYFDTMRHSLMTEVPASRDGQRVIVEVPTRYSASHFGALYNLQLTESVVLTPRVGYQSVSYALAFNRLFNSVFYQSLDIGLDISWSSPSALVLTLGSRLRPALDPGSTEQRFGIPDGGLGWRLDAQARYPLWQGLHAEAAYQIQRFSTTFVDEDAGRATRQEADASDTYHTLSVGLRYIF